MFSLSETQLAQYHRDGFMLIPGLFDKEEMEMLLQVSRRDRGMIDGAMKNSRDGAGRESKISLWDYEKDDLYGMFARCERTAGTMEKLLDGEVYHYHSKMMLKEPEVGGAWEWHQDYGYWYNNNHLFPKMASCQIAVDGAYKENGCLQVLKGSHLMGRLNHGTVGTQTGADPLRVEAAHKAFEKVYVEMDPGTALFFHSNLLHCSAANLSKKPRWTLICCYNSAQNQPFKHVSHAEYHKLVKVPDSAVKEVGRKAVRLQSVTASAELLKDPATALEVVVLKTSHVEARILPAAGANLFSLKVGGVEFLHASEDIKALRGFMSGNPVLYPMPNRVAKSRFAFEQRLYHYPPNERNHFLHGLAHNVAWKVEGQGSDDAGPWVRMSLDFLPGSKVYEAFSFENRISLTFRLQADGVQIHHEVQNLGWKRLPFGLGYHPWFKVLGERKNTFIQVPARWNMEDEGLIPTGRLIPLDHSAKDLREPVCLEKVGVDTVYAGMETQHPMKIQYRDKGLELRLEASEAFTHSVVYTPAGKPYFCLENQTCSTDAHNLAARGLKEEAHLIVLEPGERHSGWVRFRVKAL